MDHTVAVDLGLQAGVIDFPSSSPSIYRLYFVIGPIFFSLAACLRRFSSGGRKRCPGFFLPPPLTSLSLFFPFFFAEIAAPTFFSPPPFVSRTSARDRTGRVLLPSPPPPLSARGERKQITPSSLRKRGYWIYCRPSFFFLLDEAPEGDGKTTLNSVTPCPQIAPFSSPFLPPLFFHGD